MRNRSLKCHVESLIQYERAYLEKLQKYRYFVSKADMKFNGFSLSIMHLILVNRYLRIYIYIMHILVKLSHKLHAEIFVTFSWNGLVKTKVTLLWVINTTVNL